MSRRYGRKWRRKARSAMAEMQTTVDRQHQQIAELRAALATANAEYNHAVRTAADNARYVAGVLRGIVGPYSGLLPPKTKAVSEMPARFSLAEYRPPHDVPMSQMSVYETFVHHELLPLVSAFENMDTPDRVGKLLHIVLTDGKCIQHFMTKEMWLSLPVEMLAYEDGVSVDDNPYDMDTPDYEDWDAGWHEAKVNDNG